MKRIISILMIVMMLSSAFEALAAITYNDITDEHWAAEYVKILTNRGILFGTPEGKILPDDNITRAEIAAMISRTYDSDEYVDLSKQTFDDILGHWARKDIEHLVDKDIIISEEYGSSFKPDEKLTRIEMIRYVLRWLKLSEQADETEGETAYNDDFDISDRDKGYIKVAAKYGIISGYPDNTIRPYGRITRGEVFKIFCEAWNIYITGEETPAPTESALPSPTPKRTGSSSGGSSSRKAVVDFSLPDTAHTDTQLEIVTKNSYVKSLEWILRKYDAEIQDYKDVPIDEYIDRTLSAEGGNCKFKCSGQFKLCAVAENSRGRKYEYAKDIAVYDVMNVSVQAVETTHTDTEIQITSSADKPISDCSQKWIIAFDGEAVEDLSEYIDGELNGDNNTVKLKKSGIYTITYTVTDAAGREFTDSKTIKVYPASGVTLTTVQTAMAGDNISVTALSELELSWYIEKDGDRKPYLEYTDGVLSDNGGIIRFGQAGTYTICAVGTDETGREFVSETKITVYAVPALDFNMPQTTHTDKEISIDADFQDIDGLSVKWYICRNSTGYKEYGIYADGELTDNGGSIQFKEQGEYAVKAEITNEIGRTYNYARKITVYPVPTVSFETVKTAHTDLIIPIVHTADLSGYNVQWYISKDGGERQPYRVYTDAVLSESGGDISFTEKGEYIVILCAEDIRGRIFEYSQSITVMPVAQLQLTLPSVAHIDTAIDISSAFTNIDTAEVAWTITKDAGEKDYTEYVEGKLTDNGGSIRFKDAGDYTITGRFKDAVGRGYETSKQIKVYNIPSVEYGNNGLPSYAYTDTDIEIKPETSNLGSLNIEWQINGKPYAEYVTGSLNNNGGTIRFKSKGHYTLTAQITDETGRKYSYSAETDIYPVPQISCLVPSYAHTDTDAELKASGSELDGISVVWNISKDGGEYQEYSAFAVGSLNNSGGKLCFKDKGEYTVKAIAVDVKGRIFEYVFDSVKVYPVPKMKVVMPSTAHTDESVSVIADFKDIDGLNVVWSLAKDGGNAEQIRSLTNNGGQLTFSEKGRYTLSYSVTDETGRVFNGSTEINIYPVTRLMFTMPEYSHTDENIEVVADFYEANDDVIWSVDGKVNTDLSISGGSLKLGKGSHTVIVEMTDETGRVFRESRNIEVYPVPVVKFGLDSGSEFPLPHYGYKDKNITVIPSVEEMNGLEIIWLISKVGQNARDYSAYVQGIMTNDGGNIIFPNTGSYTLTAHITDETGRVFEYSEDIIINTIPEFDFIMDEYGYTDTDIDITAQTDGKDIKWTIAKGNEQPKDYDEYVSGSLSDSGGRVRFKSAGVYTVVMYLTDISGDTYSCTRKIKLLAPPNMNISTSEYAYVNETVTISSENENMSNLNVQWYINDKAYQTYAEGTLANSGGSVKFPIDGTYTVKAEVTDEYGRNYEFASESIVIYPDLTPKFTIPLYIYANKYINIEVSAGDNIVWTINGKPYNTLSTGTLTDDGGRIQFADDGDYTVTATITDEKGKDFVYSQTITVYAMSSLGIEVSKNSAYIGEAITVIANTDGNVSWHISKDSGEKQNYLTYASGSLTNAGGELSFKETGTYELEAVVSDDLGKTYTKTAVITITENPEVTLTSDKKTAYVSEAVRISTELANMEGSSISWYISKDGEKKPYQSYVTGTLSNYGGNIYFLQSGEYTVYALLTDSSGKETEYSCLVTIFEHTGITLTMPETGYIGIGNKVITSISNDEWKNIKWYISKDGGSRKNYLDYADGALTDNGGQITFNSTGTYILYAELTDSAGTKISASESITIYKLPTSDIVVPEMTHTDTPVTVTASIANTSNGVTWYVKKNNGSEQLYTNYCSGSLSKTGGQISFASYGTYKLIARVTDAGGQNRDFETTIRVYPKPNLTTTLAQRMHIDSSYSARYTVSKWGNQNIEWKLEKDGTPVDMNDYGTFDFSGGYIRAEVNILGTYTLVAYVEDETEKVFRYDIPIEVYNTAPYISGVTVSKTRNYKSGKYYTTLSPSSVDPDGDSITGYEYQNKPSDNYYPVGTTYVKVRSKDVYGKYSDWYTVSVTINNSAPNAPTITRTPNTISVIPRTPVTVQASASDPDGDAVHYEWEGYREDGLYPLGKNILKCYAVDTAGLRSAPTGVVFFIADESNGGGMELVDEESRIVEEGIEGATISKYEFNVPEVAGHSGNDYGQVQGYNVHTGEWELIERRDVSNGITMTGTLEEGKYSKLEFFYYASHCMYNKCNITYNVEFFFPAE